MDDSGFEVNDPDGVDVSHVAPSLPGMTVIVEVEVTAVSGPRIRWSVLSSDDRDTISQGTHHRAVIDTERLIDRVTDKAAQVSTLRDRPPGNLKQQHRALPRTPAHRQLRTFCATTTLGRRTTL
ncbi:hypothetical protein AWN90_32210 [Nocardia terpenica]|uniref:Fluoroacetyl-CoA-specific thioesterase-like domain-containing protein n=2 Tax=Nocardia terpenica TaxID=455432 RepID=A0A164MG03_9NOCA|nr:hypothetical protein AWN90_32210 [Nocardia terpenica]